MPMDEFGNYTYDPNDSNGNTGVTGTGGATGNPAPTPQPTDNRQGVADAYRRYLGRDLTDNEYGFWSGNTNYETGIKNSPEAQQYAKTGQGGNYWNPGAAPEGFDAAKWGNQNFTSPKYTAGRILAAGGSIQQAAQAIGATVIDKTRMRLPSGEVIDTRRDEEGANALQWLVLGGGANQGNNWTTPGTGGTGSGSTNPHGTGSAGTSGSVFSDPATSQWEQLIRQLTDRLNQPVPAATQELQQTQALDPLERQRQQQKQQTQLQLSQRGITPGSGVYDDAMANIDRQFNELRTRTQAGFANTAAQTAEQRAMQATQLFGQIPQYQDTRLGLAQGTMLNSNPYQALSLMQQYQQMQNQNGQYNDAQNQQFWQWLGSMLSGALQ
jgi:hypothetical protein